MRYSVFLVALASSLPQAAFSQEPKPTLSYSWKGVEGCHSNGLSPAFKISNFPAAARTVALALTQGQRELGGGETTLPPDGQIPAGALRVRTPCNEGIYRWTAILKTQTGVISATIQEDRRFPEPGK
jgi:hypothetical protein